MAEAGSSDPTHQAETRHRIANVFQLLTTLTRMRLDRAPSEDGQRQLSWMLEMVQALGALQHRRLSPGGEDFSPFLEDLAVQWRRRSSGRPITITLSAASIDVPESRASALAIIANELVLNAIAHAFPDDAPGEISITLERLGTERAVLSVSDDGRGYDVQSVDKTRLGLWLVSGLTSQVKGVLSTQTDHGVHCRLEFPLPAVAAGAA